VQIMREIILNNLGHWLSMMSYKWQCTAQDEEGKRDHSNTALLYATREDGGRNNGPW
jgi:hypothetical protein